MKRKNIFTKWGLLIVVFIYVFFSSIYARASELTFKFTIPSLGGDPLLGGYYLQQAQLQNKFKEGRKPLFQPKTLLERFTESFTNQLLYRMANAILNQMFGENGEINEGTYTIGNYKIVLRSEQRDSTDYYIFEITDMSTGQTTTLELPKYI